MYDVHEVDCSTGVESVRPMTAEEAAAYDALIAEKLKVDTDETQRAAKRTDILNKIASVVGVGADELRQALQV